MKLEIFQGKDEQHYFRGVGDNGKNILRSEGYTSKSSAKNGAESVEKNLKSRGNDALTMKESKDGKFFFNVKSTNGQIIATSRLYATKAELDEVLKEIL